MEKPLTVREAAKYLGVNEATIRTFCKEGVFPNSFRTGFAINSHWRIPKSDLIAYQRRFQDKGKQK